MKIEDFKTETFNDGDWEYYFASELYMHPRMMMNGWTKNSFSIFLTNPVVKDDEIMEVIVNSQYLASQGQFKITRDTDRISPEMKDRILKHLGRELVKLWKSS